jgi:hypothetical protein
VVLRTLSSLGAGLGPVAGLLLAGCVSTSSAPPLAVAPSCASGAGLAGVWKSARSSQLGPASMNFRFNCDCTYEATTRLVFKVIREKGEYWVTDDRLSLTRSSGEVTTWPFALDGGRLVLEESANESHRYERKARRDCAQSRWEPPGTSAGG